ncbi:MAG: hypothetical protein FJ260_10970 [Planctomycetes bacterium]|nr:hypothetical protein [Planctomycetota bacterium]
MHPWTITRAEWIGQRITLGKHFGYMVLGLVVSLLAGGALCAWGSSPTRVMVGVTYLCASVSLIPALRQNRRRSRALDRIWDAEGCVCPACLASVRDRPCKHGVHAGQQPLLTRYWEAVATQQMFEARALRRQLLAPRRWTLPLGQVWWLIDPAVPMSRRLLVAACCSLALILPILIAVRVLSGIYVPGPLMLMLLNAPLLAVIMSSLNPGKRGRSCCSACLQQLADNPPARCPECNADLAVAGAVTSVQRPGTVKITVVVTAMALVMSVGIAATMRVKLPPWLALQMARMTGPPPMLFYDLDRQQLTPSETRQAAELALEAVERSGEVSANGLLAGALANGVLDESWAKRMAMAGVSVRAEPRIEDGLLKVGLVPTIGKNLFAVPGRAGVEPRVVLLAAALDGVTMELGDTRALTRREVDPYLRAATMMELRQEPSSAGEPDRFTVTAPVEALGDGEHLLKVRFAVVVTGRKYRPYEPEFRVDGSLITPADAIVNGQERVYPLDLEVTITLPLR